MLMLYFSLLISIACSVPVLPKKEENHDEGVLPNVEYSAYLKQVIDVLESDPEFKKKVESMGNDTDILRVADHLELVSHHVRSKLDELKRLEITRLNKLEKKLDKLQVKQNLSLTLVDKDHINTADDRSFEKDDLVKLISKTVQIVNQIDEEAEQEFRRYEMEKEMKRRLRLSKIKSKEMRERTRLLEEEARKRHVNHPPMHHPGSQEQLKDVWEKEDKLDPNSFNPITFFRIHDTNEDGHLDIAEVEAIMQIELRKVFDPNNSDDDMVEMYNEMLRMRKEVFKEADTNNDKMISFGEFIRWTKSDEFKQDSEWKTREEVNQTIFTDAEFEKFAKEYKEIHPEEVESIKKEEANVL